MLLSKYTSQKGDTGGMLVIVMRTPRIFDCGDGIAIMWCIAYLVLVPNVSSIEVVLDSTTGADRNEVMLVVHCYASSTSSLGSWCAMFFSMTRHRSSDRFLYAASAVDGHS